MKTQSHYHQTRSYIENRPRAFSTVRPLRYVLAIAALLGVADLSAAPETAASDSGSSITGYAEGELSIGKLTGMKVDGPTGERVGKIQDLIINVTTGRAAVALVGPEDPTEGASLPVPFAGLSLQLDETSPSATPDKASAEWYKEGSFTLNATQDRLNSLPDFQAGSDIDRSIRSNLDWIDKAFGASVFTGESEREDAKLMLGSDLAEAVISDRDGNGLPVDRLLIDAAGNGKATYIITDTTGTEIRVAFSELRWESDTKAIYIKETEATGAAAVR